MTIVESKSSKEKYDKPAVIFIFYDESTTSVLLEKRNRPGNYFDGALFYPGGLVEDIEKDDYNKALKREI